MLRRDLTNLVSSAIDGLVASGRLPAGAESIEFEISETKNPEHGDYACNYALVAAKHLGINPRQIAESLATELPRSQEPALGGIGAGGGANPIQSVQIAGPGFLNLRLDPAAVGAYVATVLGESLHALARVSEPLAINVEFVSVNPNGPITVGSGRGAAYGDTLCRVLSAVGHRVHREYYINDGVNSEQMRQFARSVEAHAKGLPLPENAYRGEYVSEVAQSIKKTLDEGLAAFEPLFARTQRHVPQLAEWMERESLEFFRIAAEAQMILRQQEDLHQFSVDFDTWFSEQSLHDSGAVEACIQQLIAKHAADEEPHRTVLKLGKGGVVEGVEKQTQAEDEDDPTSQKPPHHGGEGESATLWLRSTKFGDDMDRVLRRRDGRLTYIASDVAYHKDKLTNESGTRKDREGNALRPVDKMITILGPDHHGYIHRLQAVVAALLEGSQQTDTSSKVDLSEIEREIFRSPEEKVACQAALAEAQKRLEVVIFQIVRFMKDGKPAPMRKRDGNIYELRDLIHQLGGGTDEQETAMSRGQGEARNEKLRKGKDVARFFYLMRSHDTHMDFDIDLATKSTDENPVFYVQYAHARICSVIAKGVESGLEMSTDHLHLLVHEREQTLIKKILDLPVELQRCATDYGVHRLTTYAIDLARTYHLFYDACRVIQLDQADLSGARLALCIATRKTLACVLEDLLGVSAPERMERETGAE